MIIIMVRRLGSGSSFFARLILEANCLMNRFGFGKFAMCGDDGDGWEAYLPNAPPEDTLGEPMRSTTSLARSTQDGSRTDRPTRWW